MVREETTRRRRDGAKIKKVGKREFVEKERERGKEG